MSRKTDQNRGQNQGHDGDAAAPQDTAANAEAAAAASGGAGTGPEDAPQAAAAPAAPEPAAATPPEDGEPAKAPPPRSTGRFVALLAVIAVAGIAGTAYFAWRISQPASGSDPALAAVDQRLSALEVRIEGMNEPSKGGDAAVEKRLAAIDAARDTLARQLDTLTGATERLAQRVEQIAGAATKQPPSAAGPPAASEEALKALGERIGALEKSVSAVRSATDGLDGVRKDVAALDRRVAAVEAKPPAPDLGAVRMVAASALRTTVDEGRPFTGPLAALRALAGDQPGVAKALAGWSDRARHGIPTEGMLAGRFPALAKLAEDRAEPPRQEGWIDRTLDRVKSLVSVRRIGAEPQGSGVPAVLARAQARLADGRLADAVKEVETLPPNVQAPFAEWLTDAKARLAADTGLAALDQATAPSP